MPYADFLSRPWRKLDVRRHSPEDEQTDVLFSQCRLEVRGLRAGIHQACFLEVEARLFKNLPDRAI